MRHHEAQMTDKLLQRSHLQQRNELIPQTDIWAQQLQTVWLTQTRQGRSERYRRHDCNGHKRGTWNGLQQALLLQKKKGKNTNESNQETRRFMYESAGHPERWIGSGRAIGQSCSL